MIFFISDAGQTNRAGLAFFFLYTVSVGHGQQEVLVKI